jgi:putative membrane protein
MDIIFVLPHIQALLNITAASLMTAAYYYIRKGNRAAHKACMIAALGVSTLFLVAYLYYHSQVGNVQFAGIGWIRPVYFSILASHIVLAALIVPLVLITFTFAIKGQFARHKKLARWTLPLWLYVSVTGVVVYLFAFHFYPQ